jgi:hypothetical protein
MRMDEKGKKLRTRQTVRKSIANERGQEKWKGEKEYSTDSL